MSVFAVFGGSFDPPHDGHKNVFKLLTRQTCFDGVILVPTGGNLLKKQSRLNSYREKIVSEWFFALMIELHAEKVCTNHWKIQHKSLILDLESLNLKETSTFRTVSRLEESNLADDLVIAIGADLVEQVRSWQFADQLIDSYCFAVVPRGGFQRVFPCDFREIPLELSNFETYEISSTIINNKSSKDYV